MKIRPMGAELFHAYRHDEANSHSSQFCESAPKKTLELLLLVTPAVCVRTLAHNQNIPSPTVPLLLPICSQSSSNQYQSEAFS